MNEPIKVWPFEDAPEELRNLSRNGGDEDWLALVPPGMDEDKLYRLSWLDYSRYGSPQRFKLPDGSEVYIAAHS